MADKNLKSCLNETLVQTLITEAPEIITGWILEYLQFKFRNDGQYMINRNRIVFTTTTAFAAELQNASGGNPDPVIVISADANATHQSVISVMEAARMAGFGRITFTTQQTQ